MKIINEIVNTLRIDYKILLFCAIYFSLLLFIISPDSPTHDLYGRVDTAWFFMCGKAWMNGMIPYVDFADSKGPLLWLIFGIGYLISPTNYFGLYILSCILYTFIGYFIYKILSIYIGDKRKCIVGVAMMAIPLFLSWFHFEIRAEDYAIFFSILSLYVTVKKIEGINVKGSSYRRLGLVLGACFSCSLLIKFNIAAMQLFFLFYLLYILIKFKDFNQIINLCKWYMIGVAAIIVPFLLYFIIQGNFGAFIQEYFVNTTKTVSYEKPFKIYIAEWMYMVIDPKRVSVFMGTVLFLWLYSRESERNKYFPLIGFLFYYGIAIHHAFGPHYLSITLFFLIFVVIYILNRISTNTIYSCFVIWGSFFFVTYFNSMREDTIALRDTFINQTSEYKKKYNYFANLISRKNNPTILFIGYDHGQGTSAEALPACKYWATQTGATQSMIADQKNAILKGIPVFIYLEEENIFKHDLLHLSHFDIEKCGYKLVGSYYDGFLFQKK